MTLVIIGAIAALLAILGPFSTGERLTLAPRFAYWLVMVAGTFSVGLLIDEWLTPHLPAHWRVLQRVAVNGLATGIGIVPVITALNYVSFGYVPNLSDWPGLLVQFLAIALIVTVIFQVLNTQGGQEQDDGEAAPPILDRLPLDKRGTLLSLSAEDHYTRIRTTKGEELVLIRLSDAMREAAPVAGLRVHRSHWIALGGVASAARKGDGAQLRMEDGADIPVSRSHIQAVKEAGLLPR